jgi:hypothetical protein
MILWRHAAAWLLIGAATVQALPVDAASAALGLAATAAEPLLVAGDELASYLRDITINSEPQGNGLALAVEGALYVEASMAQSANIACGRRIERGGRTLCAIPVTKLSDDGTRVDVTVPIGAFQRTKLAARAPLAAIPELSPDRLFYTNYDLSSSIVQGQFAGTANVRGGIRFDENAFDLGGIVSHNPGTYYNEQTWTTDLLSTGSGATRVTLTDAAYRRFWYDDFVTLMAGRGSMRQRGYLAGGLFDGLGLTKDNFDAQGNPRTALSRAITGYNASAGVLTYRLGETVLKQLPIAAGPYSIDPALFAGLPQGGVIEITGYDGRVTQLSLPVNAFRTQGLFEAGTWDGDVQIGRALSAGGGYVAALQFGAREGLTDDLTIEAGGSFTPRSAALNIGVDARLPGNIGVIGATGAAQARRLNPALPLTIQREQGWSLAGYLEHREGRVSIGADYQRFGGGGILTGGYDGQRPGSYYWPVSGTVVGSVGSGLAVGGIVGGGGILSPAVYTPGLIGSSIEEDLRLYLNGPLFDTGISGNLALRSTRYALEPQAMRFAELQINGGLGSLGNLALYARYGRDGYGRSLLSANANWSTSLGGSVNASAGWQTDRVDGERTQQDRFTLTLGGSDASRWSQADQWNLMVDNLGYATASYNREFAALSTAANLVRNPGGRISGTLAARGALAIADDHLVFGRSTNTTPVVLAAPSLPDEDVYYGGQSTPVTRTDGAGYAILPNPLVFRENRVRVNDAHAPLGLQVPDQVMNGTVYPYRGYVVPVATRMLVPARVFASLPFNPADANAYADVDGAQIPVEPDGSIYLEDASRVARTILVAWQVGDATRACAIALDAVKQALGGAEKKGEVVRRLAGLACTPATPPAADGSTPTVPAEPVAPQLPYLQISDASLDTSVTAAFTRH